VKTALFSDFSR